MRTLKILTTLISSNSQIPGLARSPKIIRVIGVNCVLKVFRVINDLRDLRVLRHLRVLKVLGILRLIRVPRIQIQQRTGLRVFSLLFFPVSLIHTRPPVSFNVYGHHCGGADPAVAQDCRGP